MELEASATLLDDGGHLQAPDTGHAGGEHEVLIWFKSDRSDTFYAPDSPCLHHGAIHTDFHDK